MHLDIKPDNILIDESLAENRAVLIDFGVSKQYDEVRGENNSTLLGLSPGYAPIEQMENTVQHFLPATDIYALGATYYKMVTGKNPPTTSDIIMSGNKIGLPKNISSLSKTLIRSCMQLNAKDRPQNIDAVLELMENKSFVSTLRKWNISFSKSGSNNESISSNKGETFMPELTLDMKKKCRYSHFCYSTFIIKHYIFREKTCSKVRISRREYEETFDCYCDVGCHSICSGCVTKAKIK